MKERLHSSSLSLLAAAWESYGRRLLALLHSQLQCHTAGGEVEEEEEEAFALSVCLLARHLADQVGRGGGGGHYTHTHLFIHALLYVTHTFIHKHLHHTAAYNLCVLYIYRVSLRRQ